MGRRKKSDKENQKKARVHEELEGLEININEFGEIESNLNIEKLNEFLNRHVDDKKLIDREDILEIKKGKFKSKKDKGKKDKKQGGKEKKD